VIDKNTLALQSVYQNLIKGCYFSYKVFTLILSVMKKVLLLSALFCFQIGLKAQKVYFIYLQSENTAPFYVRMAGQIQSSTSEGYLIIPNLRDSVYLVSIGQPGKQDEPRFTITISRGDRGFLIKNIGGTVSLFDLQTLAVYKPISAETTTTPRVTRNDNFTRLLAKVADDTTLLSEPVVIVKEQKTKPKEDQPEVAAVKENVAPKENSGQTTSTPGVVTRDKVLIETPAAEKDSGDVVSKKTEVAPEPIKDSVLTVKKQEVPATNQEVPATNKEEYKRSQVTKKSEISTSDGFGLIFLDELNGIVDTIQLVIPNPKIIFVDTAEKQQAQAKQVPESSTEKDSVKDKAPVNSLETSANLKSQCISLATDDDFFKMRRDMTAKNNDEEMIAEAKKHFKSKCFRTEQIKYLTSLFLTEESKYQFFDAAYMHVSDQEKFKFLQSELKDNYYINRFKALIGN
jgi:hypothetical protein